VRLDLRESSPRIIGAVWLLYFVTSIVGGLPYQGSLVPGDTAAAFLSLSLTMAFFSFAGCLVQVFCATRRKVDRVLDHGHGDPDHR
jgi:hypothetical protein